MESAAKQAVEGKQITLKKWKLELKIIRNTLLSVRLFTNADRKLGEGG